jgi:hypothetical protein
MQNVGELALDKGQIANRKMSLFALDTVQDCDHNRCPIEEKCSYQKFGKCSVQMKYLEALYGAILGTYGKYLDEAMLFKIGMQIVPLYVMLVKMQMVEMSLDGPTYETEKGAVLAHPIYKEIRETLKTIHTMWKDLDLSFSFGQKPDPGGGTPTVPGDTGDVERGDPTYYERISKENVSRKGIVR